MLALRQACKAWNAAKRRPQPNESCYGSFSHQTLVPARVGGCGDSGGRRRRRRNSR